MSAAALVAIALSGWIHGVNEPQAQRQPITVADFIQMTELGHLQAFNGSPVANVSPDGSKFVVLLRAGNIQHNTIKYSLLLWRTAPTVKANKPENVTSMESSSNGPGIKDVRWLADNETLAFLGESSGGSQQIFTVNIRTHRLKQITHHPTNVVSFSITPTGATVAFVAEPREMQLFSGAARRTGVIVSTQMLPDLLADKMNTDGRDGLFVQARGGKARCLRLSEPVLSWTGDTLDLSPDGKYVAVRTYLTSVSASWSKYDDKEMRRLMAAAEGLQPGQHSELSTYVLVEVLSGRSRRVIDAPLSGNNDSRAMWAPDSHSLVITDTYLPLEGIADTRELALRQSKTFAVEVEARSAAFVKISSEELQVLRWDPKTGLLTFRGGSRWAEDDKTEISFRRSAHGWKKTGQLTAQESRPRIVLEQDMNTPPRLFLLEGIDGKKKLLFDLNPQFSKIAFGKVEHIHWTTTAGDERDGGLYYPVDYKDGHRYPLVIQNHGFQSDKFEIGPGYSGFAAQPLAGDGIMVLQVGLNRNPTDPSKEAENELAAYESAIDYLDHRGLIQRDRVGISGFSRTCLHVKYALTHSKYPFVAATVTDGIDGGYFQYMAFANSKPGLIQNYELLNGGKPFGSGLEPWTQKSPGFNIEKVNTAVRITALTNSYSLLGEWEWFAGLTRLGRPVELIVLSDGAHVLQRPWDRLISQQGTVDWFEFWLEDKEDSDPGKAGQYARWREMRDHARITRLGSSLSK